MAKGLKSAQQVSSSSQGVPEFYSLIWAHKVRFPGRWGFLESKKKKMSKKLSRVEDVTFIERLCLKRSKHGIDPSRCLRIHSGHIFWHVQKRVRFQTSMNNLTSQDQFTYSSVYGWLAQTNTMNLNIQPPWDALNEKI